MVLRQQKWYRMHYIMHSETRSGDDYREVPCNG